MAAGSKGANRRFLRPTLLLVGEGLAEYNFLAKIKGEATSRGRGPSVTLREASGKGALHVVDYAYGQWKRSAIDRCAVLLDSDTSCYGSAVARARQKRIVLLANEPCFEATLLKVAGVTPVPARTKECKREFFDRFGCEAHADGVLKRHFSAGDDLLRACIGVQPLDDLLELLAVKVRPE